MSSTKGLKMYQKVDGLSWIKIATALPGCITVLQEFKNQGAESSVASHLMDYQKTEQLRLVLEGKELDYEDIKWSAFGSIIQSSALISSVFAGLKAAEESVEELLEFYEFESYRESVFGQLPASEKRKVELLEVFAAEKQVVVLSDPFQPFSGRWREYFAKKLLKLAKVKDLTIIVCNLSFMPKSWQEAKELNAIDIESVISKEQEKLKAAAERKAQKAPDSNPHDKSKELTEKQKELFRYLSNLSYAYKERSDLIFAPLASLASKLREYSVLFSALGLAVLTVLLVIMLKPNLPKAGKRFRESAVQSYLNPSEKFPKVLGGSPKMKGIAASQMITRELTPSAIKPPQLIRLSDKQELFKILSLIIEEGKNMHGPYCALDQ